jgi:oligopeptidase A
MTTQTSTFPPLTPAGLPDFGRIQVGQVVPGIRSLIETAKGQLISLEDGTEATWEHTQERVLLLTNPLSSAWDVVMHLLGVQSSPELRDAIAEVQPDVTAFFQSLHQSQPLFDAFKSLGADPKGLDAVQRRLLDKSIRQCELSGIGLEGPQRKLFNANQKRLATLGREFGDAVLDSTKSYLKVLTTRAEVSGIPESQLERAAERARKSGDSDATAAGGPWHFTLDAATAMPCLECADNPDLRESIYSALYHRASDGETNNKPRIQEILALRKSQAELLGFKSFAEVCFEDRMASGVDEARDLLLDLRQRLKPQALLDLEALGDFAAQNGGPPNGELKNWDVPYWSRKLRIARLDFDAEALRPYFPFPHVLRGVLDLFQDLLGIRIVDAQGETPVWDESVRYFRIYDEAGADIASFYLDAFARPENKRGGAWVCGQHGRSLVLAGEGEGPQLPAPYVTCNFPGPVGETPSLLSFNEVRTLLHEFGHALQRMLTTVDYDAAAGSNGIVRDARELPSQFMENWRYQRAVIDKLSQHWKTGEVLPDQLFDKLAPARTFDIAGGLLRQINLGLVDLALHHEYDPHGSESAFVFAERMSLETLVMPPLAGALTLCSFGHIFSGGYTAGYYSYLWAEVLSADAFGAFEEAGLEDVDAVRSLGRKFRDTILALGDSEGPAAIYEKFRGRPATVDALLRHLGVN